MRRKLVFVYLFTYLSLFDALQSMYWDKDSCCNYAMTNNDIFQYCHAKSYENIDSHSINVIWEFRNEKNQTPNEKKLFKFFLININIHVWKFIWNSFWSCRYVLNLHKSSTYILNDFHSGVWDCYSFTCVWNSIACIHCTWYIRAIHCTLNINVHVYIKALSTYWFWKCFGHLNQIALLH